LSSLYRFKKRQTEIEHQGGPVKDGIKERESLNEIMINIQTNMAGREIARCADDALTGSLST